MRAPARARVLYCVCVLSRPGGGRGKGEKTRRQPLRHTRVRSHVNNRALRQYAAVDKLLVCSRTIIFRSAAHIYPRAVFSPLIAALCPSPRAPLLVPFSLTRRDADYTAGKRSLRPENTIGFPRVYLLFPGTVCRRLFAEPRQTPLGHGYGPGRRATSDEIGSVEYCRADLYARTLW